MSLTSIEFCLFFLIIYIGYWLLKDRYKQQNVYLLIANYLFYSIIDWRFSFLLLFISLLSFVTGLLLNDCCNNQRKIFLLVAISINIGILFVFKYFDFFAKELSSLLAINQDALLLKLVLPVGISFYIFTATGYIIDVYQRKTEANIEVVPFLCFISFFPLLLSGPIERSHGLLPQFKQPRVFNESQVFEGVQQIIWGAFKKLVIADNCATIVNVVFVNYEDMPASSLVVGGVLYSFQIYYDFSGYSDMAIGFSKLLGFKVRRNFNYPYFALNVADFWRRWHMSLQSWLTEYIYYPLGGSRCSMRRTLYNTFIVFLLCGIWHGANWTFIVWGLYHAFLFVPLLLFFSKGFKKKTVDSEGMVPSLKAVIQMLITFGLITIGWIIFNSSSMTTAIGFLTGIISPSIISIPENIGLSDNSYVLLLLLLTLLFEWLNRCKEAPVFFNSPIWIKVGFLYILLGHMVFCDASQTDFIYYQF